MSICDQDDGASECVILMIGVLIEKNYLGTILQRRSPEKYSGYPKNFHNPDDKEDCEENGVQCECIDFEIVGNHFDLGIYDCPYNPKLLYVGIPFTKHYIKYGCDRLNTEENPTDIVKLCEEAKDLFRSHVKLYTSAGSFG
jgi:hypothetical protein